MRKAAGLKVAPVATQLGWPNSKVSKLQNGRQIPTVEDITAWATACGHPEAASELLDILAQVRNVHWQWRHRLSRGHAAVQDDLDRAVRAATRIRVMESAAIPGLLQTTDYARCIYTMVTDLYQMPPEEIEPAVAARMRRQEVLYDAGRQFEFLIAEHVLRQQVGDARVMLGQMDRLLTLSGLSNITLGILPEAPALRIIPGESFMALDGQVILETWVEEDRMTDESAALLLRLADMVAPQAITGDGARRLIQEAAERWRAA